MRVTPAGTVDCARTQSEAFVPYIIASHGRPIGTTELNFFRLDGSTRSGWFRPNALGETLMPTIALVLPAMCAFVNRDAKGEDGQGIVKQSFRKSSLFADLAEALQNMAALDLTLHHEDGSLIPTEMVGLQDAEQLLSLTNWNDVEECDRSHENEGDFSSSPLDADVAHDLELPSAEWQVFGDDFETTSGEDWLPDTVPDPNERYQVHIQLSEANAIP
jgi:hypothetical protein